MHIQRLLLCGVLFLTCGGSRLPRVNESPAHFVPDDAAIYVELNDASKIIDRLLAPDIVGTLESIEQFRRYTQSDEYAEFRSVVTYLETKLDRGWREAVSELSGGGAVLAIRPGKPDYVLFVMRSKDGDLLRRAHQQLIELVEKDARDKGRESPVKSKEYKGVMAWSLGKNEYHAIIGDTLVVSNRQEGLKTALEMHAGEGPRSIALLDSWKSARERVPTGSVAWSFARLDVLREAGVAKELFAERAKNAAVPILFGGLSEVLRTAPYAVGSLELDGERLAARVELPREGGEWPEAYRGFYASRAGEEAAEPLRPARTIASLSFYRDLKAMWDAREQLVSAEGLPGVANLESEASPVLFGNREFSREVLGEFGPRFRMVAAAQEYSSARATPEIKIPAFALIAELNRPQDFAPDLYIGYQSILGLANVNFGQKGQPRFLLGTETHRGHEIQTARFFERAAARSDTSVTHLRHNFSPSCAVAGRYFILGSTSDIVRDCIDALGDVNAAPKTTPHNVVFETHMRSIIDLLVQNREPLISQNMVSSGNTREQAEQEYDALVQVLGLFGDGRATWTAEPESMHVDLSVAWGKSRNP